MSTDEETDMIRETVAKFVDRELIPLEPHYLRSKLPGSDHPELSVEQKQRLRTFKRGCGASMPRQTLAATILPTSHWSASTRNCRLRRPTRCRRTRRTCAC